jgi:HAMP domain-containing protein/signal transduction histidine kinase/DNA-binding response OmpR family regulator
MRLSGRPGASTSPRERRRRSPAPTPPATTDRVDERILLSVLTSFKKGDFSARLPVEWTGVAGRISDTLNDLVEINQKMARELERLSRVVGKEGKLNQRANLSEFSGAWAHSVGCVNSLIEDLVYPDSEMARVIGAVAKGDLSQSMSLEADGHPIQGEFLRTAKTVNRMVDQLRSFASEVTRVAREVGTEGKLGGQAQVKGVAGTWKDLTDSVNSMASNLTGQVRNIAAVTTAVANGDLSKKITVDVKGEILELKDTINTMVDQLRSFASEVTRVAREVGTEGRLGGQADVKGVAGTWKDLTDSVNSMAGNLTAQVRNIADVTKAVANGDLSKKITVDVRGEILELKDTINTMVDQLRSFASEVTRVAREVGTEGKLGGQADVKGVAGTWKDLTDSVNFMASNLTGQVRNIAEVTTAVANGDLSKKIAVQVKGEILELKDTINTMVDQLRSFAAEVTRVAREVGTEGKLGGQADVKGVAGTWKDLTDSVNFMASNLTGQVRNIAEVTTAVANGDLSKKITVHVKGEILELKDTINAMVDQLRSFASEVTRVAREVGTEGKLGGQADVKGVAGTWKDLTDSVNFMASNLTGQVRNIAEVTTAVAKGDLSKQITVDVKGEILELKNTINTMVDQLSSFASEVTRVAREVGTEGKLGGQADVRGVSGTWKDLTDNVNFMAGNLTNQVRNIAKVVTAVAVGDLTQKLTVDAKGEIAKLAATINGMIDTLETFADQVTTVAREVGAEGKLGGQASVPGAAGTWKHLTDNVNQLAANLTTQVRAIAEVATAVTKGDLTRSITVDARGELASLKDNINEMIRNLNDTTLKNSEQDWLKTNLASFTRMLQGQRDLLTVARLILSELAPVVGAQHGVFYIMEGRRDAPELKLLASYAYRNRKGVSNVFKLGEGLVGQAALEREKIVLEHVPADYIQITSGLGEAPPLNALVLPVLFEDEVKGVLELASFERFSDTHQQFLDQLMESVGIVLHTIQANSRTEGLLAQSQSLATELQSRQLELQKTNAELEEKATLLAEQNAEVERKNAEVEQARQALEEKASQLALTSKYKSEFLANMSHELRTPLNSLLILAEQLSMNGEQHLSSREVEYARTILSSGNDLLKLINDILDLAKIESGTVSVDVGTVAFRDLDVFVTRTFRPIAESKKLKLSVELDPRLPQSMITDSKRLQQILRNLLSNAFKFTERGSVTFRVEPVNEGWSPDHFTLNRARSVIAFCVADTGVGIQPQKQSIIFEAFQQEDGSTSRRYGGTGLGLAISRELARLLGGEIRLTSTPGQGSAFHLYLPQAYASHRRPRTEAFGGYRGQPIARPEAAPAELEPEVVDDRSSILPGDRVLLVVEDDPAFAQVVREAAHSHGFKAFIESRGAAAVTLARELRPDAITLDLGLPDIDGRRVLTCLKGDLSTRHIPVHVISVEQEPGDPLRRGARGVLAKPASVAALDAALLEMRGFVDRPIKKLLFLSSDDAMRAMATETIGNSDVLTTVAASASEAREVLAREPFDCVAVDAGMTEHEGVELAEGLVVGGRKPPVVVFADVRLDESTQRRVERLARAESVRVVASMEELFDVTSLILHRAAQSLPEARREMLERLYPSDGALAGRTVLIVDDDVRNIFAMTSLLERHGMKVLSAETGPEGITALRNPGGVDLVLMDIMLPEMDGYETMRAIRGEETFRDLPIVALTAKAMKGDREKCIEAGASDYLAKPVDTTSLLSTVRLWLTR